jgi:hypothetical protein
LSIVLTVAIRHRDQHSVVSLPRTTLPQGCSNIPLCSCQGAGPPLRADIDCTTPVQPRQAPVALLL